MRRAKRLRAGQPGTEAVAPERASSARPEPARGPRLRAPRGGRCAGLLRESGDLARPVRARVRRAPGRDDLGEQADRQRLAGVDRAAGQDQVQRPAGADHARQPLRAAVDQRDAPAALGAAERGGRGSRSAGRTRARARGRRRGSGREIAAIVGFGRGEAGEAERAAGRVGVERLERLQVGAGAEGPLTRAGEDEHVGVVVVVKRSKASSSALRGRAVDRVVALGPVDGDERGWAVALVADHQPPRRSARAVRAFAAARRRSLRPRAGWSAIEQDPHEQREAGDQDEAGVRDDLVVRLALSAFAAVVAVRSGERDGRAEREDPEREQRGADHAARIPILVGDGCRPRIRSRQGHGGRAPAPGRLVQARTPRPADPVRPQRLGQDDAAADALRGERDRRRRAGLRQGRPGRRCTTSARRATAT